MVLPAPFGPSNPTISPWCTSTETSLTTALFLYFFTRCSALKTIILSNTIQSKNTLAIVDKIYKGVYNEGLFEAMKDEAALNNALYTAFSDKTKYNIAIPFITEGKWHPVFAAYFQSLKDY